MKRLMDVANHVFEPHQIVRKNRVIFAGLESPREHSNLRYCIYDIRWARRRAIRRERGIVIVPISVLQLVIIADVVGGVGSRGVLTVICVTLGAFNAV